MHQQLYDGKKMLTFYGNLYCQYVYLKYILVKYMNEMAVSKNSVNDLKIIAMYK